MKRNSKELKKKRFKKKIKRFLFWYFFPSVLFFALFIFIFNTSFLAIKKIKIEIKDSKYINKEEVREKIENILEEKYWGIFSKRNFIFYPSSEIEKKILKKYPEIKKIDIKWGEFLKDINIDMEGEKSEYIYCDNNLYSNCYNVSFDGKIFKKTQFNRESKKLILISAIKLKKNDMFFKSTEERKKIISIINFLKNTKKIKVKYFIKKNKYFYILKLEDDVKILVNSDFLRDDVVLKINKIFNQKNFNFKKIDYIDLSLKNRLSYCLKGDVCEKNFKNF